jgi:hypothetical protein
MDFSYFGPYSTNGIFFMFYLGKNSTFTWDVDPKARDKQTSVYASLFLVTIFEFCFQVYLFFKDRKFGRSGELQSLQN